MKIMNFTIHKRNANESNQDTIFYLSDSFKNEKMLIPCSLTIEKLKSPLFILCQHINSYNIYPKICAYSY